MPPAASNGSTRRGGRVYVGKPSCGEVGKRSLSQTFRVLGNEGDHMSTPGARYPLIGGGLSGSWEARRRLETCLYQMSTCWSECSESSRSRLELSREVKAVDPTPLARERAAKTGFVRLRSRRDPGEGWSWGLCGTSETLRGARSPPPSGPPGRLRLLPARGERHEITVAFTAVN